jgi:alpha-D-xyloside xylohydrolase
MTQPSQSLSRLAIGLLVFSSIARAQWTPMNPVRSVHPETDVVTFAMGAGTWKLEVSSDSVIHVLYSPSPSFPRQTDFVVTRDHWPATKWTMETQPDEAVLRTSRLKVTVARKDGAITYAEGNGNSLLVEASRTLTPARINGEDIYRSESFFNIYGAHEELYGLGQHQAGVWNYRGESVDIVPDNSNISVPLLVSSKGYGIFWNSMARSRFNNRFANYFYVSSEAVDVIDYYFL